MNKKIISILLCLLMLISTFAVSASAEGPDSETYASEESSENIYNVECFDDNSSSDKNEKLSWETFKQDMDIVRNDLAAIPFFGIFGTFFMVLFLFAAPINIFWSIVGAL